MDVARPMPGFNPDLFDGPRAGAEAVAKKVAKTIEDWKVLAREKIKGSSPLLDEISDDSTLAPEVPLRPLQDVIFTRQLPKGQLETKNLTKDYVEQFHYIFSRKHLAN